MDERARVELGDTPGEVGALDARDGVVDAAGELRDVQVRDGPWPQMVDDVGQRATPRDTKAHARREQALDVFGGHGAEQIVCAFASVRRDDRAREPIARRQLETEVDLLAAGRADLDVDDALA